MNMNITNRGRLSRNRMLRFLRSVFRLAGVVSLLGLSVSAVHASATGRKWHFPIGVAYSPGISDLTDAMERAEYVDITSWPVGLHFDPNYQIDDALAIGGSVGPIFIMTGDLDAVIVPVGLDLRYTFAPKAPTSGYVRAGGRYPIADGDLLGDTKLGAFGAIGVSFNRQRKVAWGAEVALDTSSVEVTTFGGYVTESVKPYKLMFSLVIEF